MSKKTVQNELDSFYLETGEKVSATTDRDERREAAIGWNLEGVDAVERRSSLKFGRGF